MGAPPPPPDAADLRARLARARLMLVFTPAAAGGRDPLELLELLAGEVDVVQVRPKPLGAEAGGVAAAREVYDLALASLSRLAGREEAPILLVDDRVDVARALWGEGIAGVHLGREDTPPALARELLGPEPLIGLSAAGMGDVARAEEEPVDYLGFGPIHATSTKGYSQGLGPELAWVADAAAAVPLFPIGGIDLTNVDALAHVGRAAVGQALLAAEDPLASARDMRALLEEEPH